MESFRPERRQCLHQQVADAASKFSRPELHFPSFSNLVCTELDDTGHHHSDPPKHTQHRDLSNIFEKCRNNVCDHGCCSFLLIKKTMALLFFQVAPRDIKREASFSLRHHSSMSVRRRRWQHLLARASKLAECSHFVL